MPAASLKTKWELTGLVPTADLQLWYQCKDGEAANGLAPDYSGFDRDAVQASNPPVITANVINGQPGWYSNGTRNPLVYNGGNVPIQHLFVLCAAEGAAFDQYRGIVTGTTAIAWMVSNNSGAKFFSPGPDYDYKKSSIAQADANIQAPMNLVPELMEVTHSSVISTPGIQMMQDFFDTARKWKGYFIELLAYSTIQTGRALERIYLYHNIKFGTYKKGVPFYFPSDDIVQPFVIPKRRRFYAEPPQWEKVTDTFGYEDGGMDFNEVADDAPRRWEYEYQLVSTNLPGDPYEAVIFDEFYNQARRSAKFMFRDKYGVEWPDVRVEDYERSHRDHKPSVQDVRFKLIKYP